MNYSEKGLISEWLELSILFKIDIFDELLNRRAFADLLAEQMISSNQKDKILNIAHDFKDEKNRQLKKQKERSNIFKIDYV